MQQQYAQALVQTRDYAAAKAWMDGALSGDAHWDAGEDEMLRNVITQMYREQDRYEDLAIYLAAWVATSPESTSAYQQYLSALIKNDRIEDATQLASEWLEAGLQPGRLAKPAAARLTAAVELVLGQGYELRTDRLDPRWWDPLARVAELHAGQGRTPDCTSEIMSNGYFQSTKQYERIRQGMFQLLSDNMATLQIQPLQRLVDWTITVDATHDAWAAVAEGLRKRWEAETHPERKHAVGQVLARVVHDKMEAADYVAFLRQRLERGPELYRTSYARSLFDLLLQGPWSAEREDEAFALLPRLSDADDPYEKMAAQVPALQQLTDAMVQLRFQTLMDKISNQSELTRTELKDKQLENMKRARTEYAERLKLRMRDAGEALAAWMNVEWTYLQVTLAENLQEVEQRCWEALGTAPSAVDTGSDVGNALQEVLLQRSFITLCNLAARRDAAG